MGLPSFPSAKQKIAPVRKIKSEKQDVCDKGQSERGYRAGNRKEKKVPPKLVHPIIPSVICQFLVRRDQSQAQVNPSQKLRPPIYV